MEFKRFLVLFRVGENEVRITNVIHAARNIEAMFKGNAE